MRARTFAVAALAAALLAGQAGAGSPPTLRLATLMPLELRGAHFSPGERVTVTLQLRQLRRARAVSASAAGSFTVRFDPLIAVDPCRGVLVVTAAGSTGTRATYKRICRPPSEAPSR